MTYTVEVTAQAEAEAEEAYLWILKRALEAAARWWNGLDAAILFLEEMPACCPLAPENDEFEEGIRELLYGKRQHRYRILFTIREQTVVVLHIRHGAMQYPFMARPRMRPITPMMWRSGSPPRSVAVRCSHPPAANATSHTVCRPSGAT